VEEILMKPFERTEKEQTELWGKIQGSAHIKTYLDGENLRQITENVIETVAKFANGFEAIAFRGVSGSLVAPAVAMALGKNLIVVRKSIKDSHADYLVEGHTKAQKYIIIDDIISSGKTIKAIRNNIKTKLNKESECIAIILFAYKVPRVIYEGDD
jgi:adenine/guanine phosphoribosyltransferase-like PRPP-binding protein